MLACCLWVYSFIFHRPAASIASAIRGYSHSPSFALQSTIPAILRADLWLNPSSTFSVSPITTELSLPYGSKVYATALYIIPWDRIIYPVFVSALDIIPHHC